LLALLSLDCAVTIVNRTYSRAHELATLFAHTGSVCALEMDRWLGMSSISLLMRRPAVSAVMCRHPASLITRTSIVMTCFTRRAARRFSLVPATWREKCADGLGMLVAQAAHAVLLWHGVLPEITPVIQAAEGTECVNQAIQFPDREDGNRQCVTFPALVNGMQLTCAIRGANVQQRFGGETRRSGWPRFVNIAGIWKKKKH
jgi:hypothetical protein